MDINQFTIKTRQALQLAQSKATNAKHTSVTPSHLFVAILTEEPSLARSILQNLGINTNLLIQDVEKHLANQPVSSTTTEVKLSNETVQILHSASTVAKKLQDSYVSIDHIVYAFFSNKNLGYSCQLLAEQKCYFRTSFARNPKVEKGKEGRNGKSRRYFSSFGKIWE